MPNLVVGLQGLLHARRQGSIPDLLPRGIIGLELDAVQEVLNELATTFHGDPLGVDHQIVQVAILPVHVEELADAGAHPLVVALRHGLGLLPGNPQPVRQALHPQG